MENCYSPTNQSYQQYANCILCMARFDCEFGVEDLQNHLLIAHQCRTNLAYILQMCFNASGYNNFQYGCYNPPNISYSKTHQQSMKSLSSSSSGSYGSSYDDLTSSCNHSSMNSQPQRSRVNSESSTASSDWSITSSDQRPHSQLSQISSNETSPLQLKTEVAAPTHFGHNLNLSTYSLTAIQTSTPTQKLEDVLQPQTLFSAISPFSEYSTKRQPKNLVADDLKQIIIANNPLLNIEFIYSQRQNDQMVLNRYILKKKKGPIVKNNKRRIYWMCIVAGCPVRVTSQEGELTYAHRGHNHMPEEADVLRRKHKAKLRGKICF